MGNKKKRKVRNKTKDVLMDYYKTNMEYDEENRRRQKEEGVTTKGLKNLTYTEKDLYRHHCLGLDRNNHKIRDTLIGGIK